jgi:hypothetical protein
VGSWRIMTHEKQKNLLSLPFKIKQNSRQNWRPRSSSCPRLLHVIVHVIFSAFYIIFGALYIIFGAFFRFVLLQNSLIFP